MGKSNYNEDFKRDAVHQILVRGYPVREVSQRLGISTHSLYKWMKMTGSSMLRRQTRSGSLTSPTSKLMRASCIWRS